MSGQNTAVVRLIQPIPAPEFIQKGLMGVDLTLAIKTRSGVEVGSDIHFPAFLRQVNNDLRMGMVTQIADIMYDGMFNAWTNKPSD